MNPDRQVASELNRELTQLLTSVGERLGFVVVCEYAVKGGRLDVVWTWNPPTVIPGLDSAVPVVGFEIESSWRTRKHVKGDLMNLQDAGVALGVIVLGGDSDKDDGLRTFATQLVDRPGANMLVWTAQDVRALAEEALSDGTVGAPPLPTAQSHVSVGALAAGTPPTDPPPTASWHASALASISHSGKYSPLHRWLRTHEGDSLSLTFADVEDVLGFPLPSSCRHHVPHWHSYEGSAVARAIIDAGWRASRVSLADQRLTLLRVAR